MKIKWVISPLRWTWITANRLLEVVGMCLLIFVLALAGLIEASREPDEQECDNDGPDGGSH